VKPYVRPEIVLFAEQHGQPIGFIFAIPDMLQAKRGQSIDTVIIKTMAVHPAHAGLGLGSLLMARCEHAAHELGYRRAIHALFHEKNRSGKISSHTGKVIRRYTLFAKPLLVQS
jgi:GNAT superfamily N-acetyltransferase